MIKKFTQFFLLLCVLSVTLSFKNNEKSIVKIVETTRNGTIDKMLTCENSPLVGTWNSKTTEAVINFSEQCLYLNQFCASSGVYNHNNNLFKGKFTLTVNSLMSRVPESCISVGAIPCDFTFDDKSQELTLACESKKEVYKRSKINSDSSFEFTRKAKASNEYVNVIELSKDTCIGDFMILNKSINSHNLNEFKNVSLANIQKELEKGLAPSGREYYSGLGVLKGSGQGGHARNFDHFSMIMPYDPNMTKNVNNYENEHFKIRFFNFSKYVDLSNVILNKLYQYEYAGEGGGTVQHQGISESFKVTKENNDIYFNMRSLSVKQYNHRTSSERLEWEFKCKFQNVAPKNVEGTKAASEEFKKEFNEVKK